jgi:membrane associated rhomboid family serine protease
MICVSISAGGNPSMKKLMDKIDRYCILHPNFGVKNLILYIVVGNLVVWLFSLMDTTQLLTDYLAFDAAAVFTKGQVWRLLTFVIVPSSTSFWTLFALYFYYWIGSALEKYWGKGKFTIYYLIGVVLTVVFGILVWLITDMSTGLTASYVNLSMFFAFATLFPDVVVLLFFIIPIKIKWLAIVDAVFFVGAVISMFSHSYGLLSLLPVVAILNYLLFCGDWLFDYLRPERVRRRRNVIDYKKAAKKYNKQQASKPYNHKCEVCGRTDADYPDLEFRFCSRCEGYHCFCIDHINNHVHFKQ